MPRYNLLDEPWIPCLRSPHDPPDYLSLPQVFEQAPQLLAITDAAPTVTAALHRLLLAILHRGLDSPRSPADWGAIWRHGSWDTARIVAYLNRWHDRFDLFSHDHPFYQTLELTATAFKDVTQLTPERASNRSRPLLFDHSLPGRGLSAAAAARYLVAYQSFSVGGLYSTNPGEGQREKIALGSPLIRSAVCLMSGATLFETLMLNWVQYDRETETPFPFAGDDRPAWERDEPVIVDDRVPDGWVDLLTWQCRRVLLRPGLDEHGGRGATDVALLQGYRLAEDFDVTTAESMVAYTLLTSPRLKTPLWVPIGLTAGRAAWRDSDAFLQSAVDQQRRPRSLDWLQRMIAEGQLEPRAEFRLNLYGLLTDKAKVKDWRHETLLAPVAFIQGSSQSAGAPDLLGPFQRGLELAEHVGRLFRARQLNLPLHPRPYRGPSPALVLREALFPGASADSLGWTGASRPDGAVNPETGYWAALEEPFRAFIRQIAAASTSNSQEGQQEHQSIAASKSEWEQAVARAAREQFTAALAAIGNSAHALKATALAQSSFNRRLRDILEVYRANQPSSAPTSAADPATAALTTASAQAPEA